MLFFGSLQKRRRNSLCRRNYQGSIPFWVYLMGQRDYDSPYTNIPPHGRWQHFNAGGRQRLEQLIQSWGNISSQDRTRRLLDLFLVSVLLDAGAGNAWKYTTKQGKKYGRSEGLAVGSLDMFEKGMFSSDKSDPHRVDCMDTLDIMTDKSCCIEGIH